MKPTPQLRRHHLRWAAVGIVLIAIAGSVIGWIVFATEEDSEETPGGRSLPYGPPSPYPDVTDLAPDAINLESDKTFPSLTYGIQTSLWWNPEYRKIGLDHINMMQFTHIRQKFAWADIEPVYLEEDDPARYQWFYSDLVVNEVEGKGIKIVARLSTPPPWALKPDVAYGDPPFDMGRLTDYCSALATRYRGRFAAYQLWNEPNLAREWAGLTPSPEGYVKLLAACATAIREADPEAVIISAGLSPTGSRDWTAIPDEEFLWRMYDAGAAAHFDILAVHAPGFKFAPERDPDESDPEGCLRWRCFRHVEHMRAIMVANGDADKQIAVTEFGWTIDPRPESIYNWFAVTPEEQADYLVRAYQYAAENWRPWVGLMIALNYPSPDWTEEDEEYWWAIGTVAPMPYGMDGRPAWPALVQMRKISTNPDYSHPPRDQYLNPIE
ncbi:MAG: hypothetical protein GYB66_05300 [Chloroflexi bacterium]|nr:hypothetical protein [Chloroflexota bacterium]